MKSNFLAIISVAPVHFLSALFAACALLFACGSGSAVAQNEGSVPPQLHVAIQGSTLSCHLTGLAAGTGDQWVLQSSADLKSWEDLVFFGKEAEAAAAIPPGGHLRQFLRARQIAADDPLLREFLSARNRWRSAGITSYTMEVSWGSSWLFWHGTVTVRDNQVISATPIETNFPDPPEQKTVDGRFAELKTYIDQKADSIEVTFDPVFGYTKSAFVDIDFRIADEERSWSILSFLPLR